MDAIEKAAIDYQNAVAGKIVADYIKSNNINYALRAEFSRQVYKEIDGIIGAVFKCGNAKEVLGALMTLWGNTFLLEDEGGGS